MKTATLFATSLVLSLSAGALQASAAERNNRDYSDYSQSDYDDAFSYRTANVTRRQMKKKYSKYSNQDFRKSFAGSKRARMANKKKYRAKSRRHSQYYDRPVYAQDIRCKRPRIIHRTLHRQGWDDFTQLRLRRYFINMKARMGNGQQYNLKLDRCTGVIISTKLVWRNYWLSSLFRYGYPMF